MNLSRLGGAILVGVVMAKMGVDLETIGQFELLFFLGKAATAFWTDAFAKAALPLFPILKEQERGRFFQTSVFLYLSFALVTGLILMGLKQPILNHFLRIESIPFYQAYVLFLVLNVPGLVLEQYYTLRKNIKGLLLYAVLSYGLVPLYFFIPIYRQVDLTLIFTILSIVAMIRLLWLLAVLVQNSRRVAPKKNSCVFCIDPNILRKLMTVGSHFMAYILIGLMAEIIDGVIINFHFEDPSVFAIFRYGARELPITTALLGGLSFASIAKLSENFFEHLPDFKKSLNRILKITLPIALVLMVSSQWIFTHVFSVDFYDSAMIFNTYLLILGSRVLMPGPLMMAKLESRFMFQVSIFELAINVILSLIFVQYWGIIGVAFATVLANYVEKVIFFIRLKKRHGVAWTDTIDAPFFMGFWVSLHLCYGAVWYILF